MNRVTMTPTLFLGHGAPPLVDDPHWPRELAQWSGALERPRNILIVSAHWENRPVTLSPTLQRRELTYDFWGFPQRYYQVRYDAPLAPELANEVARLLGEAGQPVARDEERGLDHGAYVPLTQMFPAADIPVLQVSMPSLDPSELYQMGRALAPLREQGTLIIGSGFTTHNLRWANMRVAPDYAPPAASVEFDQWAAETVAAGDVDALLDYARRAPAAQQAHPWPDHWAPIYLALGASTGGDASGGRSIINGFWYGLSKRSWQFG